MTGTRITLNTASDYLEKIVIPDYDDFRNNPTDLRLALHVAVSLFQLRDWVLEERGAIKGWRRAEDIQTFLQNKCNDFGLIKDIANSSKHLVLKRPSTPLTGMTGAGQVLTTMVPTAVLAKMDAREYDEDSGSAVVIEVPDRKALMFAAIAESVLKMWKDLFLTEGWWPVPLTWSS
jgi:hypothetical protein